MRKGKNYWTTGKAVVNIYGTWPHQRAPEESAIPMRMHLKKKKKCILLETDEKLHQLTPKCDKKTDKLLSIDNKVDDLKVFRHLLIDFLIST